VIRILEDKNFAHLATIMPDGTPQVTPVWVDHDGDFILVNTAMGRVKQKNVTRDPRVSLSIIEQDNPYNRVVIFGRVKEQITAGAEAHIDKLAAKYTGAKKFVKNKPDEVRVIFKIEPQRIL